MWTVKYKQRGFGNEWHVYEVITGSFARANLRAQELSRRDSTGAFKVARDSGEAK